MWAFFILGVSLGDNGNTQRAMEKRAVRIITFFFLLHFVAAIQSHAQDSETAYIDSVQTVFNKETGQSRVLLIAEFIRFANFLETDHQPFKPYLEELYAWEQGHPNQQLLTTIKLGHINMLVAEENSLDAAAMLTEILESNISLTPEDSVSAFSFLADIYMNANAYAEAWEIIQLREEVLSNNTSDTPFFKGYEKIRLTDAAGVQYRLGEFEEAVSIYRTLLTKVGQENDLHSEAGNYNNIGLALLEVQQTDSAIISFVKAIERWKIYLSVKPYVSPQDSAFLDIIYGNIGHAYNQKGRFREAIPLLENDLASCLHIEYYEGAINALNELSRSYFGLQDYPKSLEMLDESTRLLEDHFFSEGMRDNKEYRVHVLEHSGKIDEAFQLYKQLVVFDDSIATLRETERLRIMEVIHQVEQKNDEIEAQTIRALTAETMAGRNRLQSQLLGTGLILLLLVTGFMTVLSVQRRKKNKILAEKNDQIAHQNEVIEESLLEKETLLKEIHHRVKNNLQIISSLLNLQSEFIEDEVAMEAVGTSQRRVMSISLVHEILYRTDDLKEVNAAEYIPKLTEYIADLFSHEKAKVDIRYDLESVRIDIKKAVPLGLILNELLTNAFKYAFREREEGVLSVSASLKGEELLLIISDDGPGFEQNPPDEDKPQSLGLQLVDDMIRQLKASKKVDTKKGTTYELSIPVTDE